MVVHIEFSPEDILEGKFILQESRLLYFQSSKSQENYTKIRGKELKLKSLLKSKFKILSSSLKFLESSLPVIDEKTIKKSGSNEKGYSFVEQDLRDIQSNLKRIKGI